MIQSIKTQNLRRMQDKEGLILQGCGGSLQEWVDGINEMFTEAGILQDGTKFSNVKSFEHDGLTCLLFSFEDDVKVDVGKLAMWRLQTHATFGGTWLSDYVPNRLGGFVHEDKLSFYCTLSGQIDPQDYEYTEELEPVSNDFLLANAWDIHERMREEQSEDNMAVYLPKELKEKITSVVWNVEEMHDHLVGRIDCTINQDLTEEETAQLKDWITGQNSDGFGEGFEQRPIRTEDGDLYVSLWQWDNDNELRSAEEMEAFLTHNGDIGIGGI